jgi:hypothetical protein
VAAANAAFVSDSGGRLNGIVAALTAGRADLDGKVGISPGVEIRSKAGGSLSLASDWNLASSGATRVGEPVTLTLRASESLNIAYSLSDGFSGTAPNSAALAGAGASFRLVGGSDFGAADLMSTRTDADAGDVVLGRAASSANSVPPIVLIRSTTGSIDIAAARDLKTYVETTRTTGDTDRRSQVRVYTTGTPVTAASTPGLDRLNIRTADQYLRSGSATVGPFFEDAGDIHLNAGRDILGSPAVVYKTPGSTSVQYVTDWWYRQTNLPGLSTTLGAALWSRYDLFAQGFASFGGGNLKMSAGRDIVDLDASTPTSGYIVAADATHAQQQRWFAGGRLDIEAGRNVVGGLFNAGGPAASLVAGGSLAGQPNPLQPASYGVTQVLYTDTQWTISASGDLRLGSMTDPAYLPGVAQGNEQSRRSDVVSNLAGHSGATLISLSGDVEMLSTRPGSASGTPGIVAATMPDEFVVVAPSGSVSVVDLAQRPVGHSSLQLLARDNVTLLGSLGLVAPVAQDAAVPSAEAIATANALFNPATAQWSRSQGTPEPADGPARLVALQGDVQLNGSFNFSARSIRVVAGRDLLFGGSTLQVQHDHVDGTDLSLLRAGRDIQFSAGSGVRVSGSGDLMAIAARDIDFGRGEGIVSVGNQDNSLQLPTGGANITLLAGVTWSDYSQAVARNMHLLGGGFENFPAELAVQLEALAGQGRLLDPAAAESAAVQFSALSLSAQQARVAAIVGADAMAQSVQSYLDRTVERAFNLSQAATEAAFSGAVVGSNRLGDKPPVAGGEFLASLPTYASPLSSIAEPVRLAREASVKQELREALQGRALGAALADKAGRLDAGTRQSLALAISPYSDALRAFVAQRSSTPVTSKADAAARFAVLAPEQQALFVNRVLTSELRAAGREALTVARVQYLRGYDAMDALFPGARPAGRITLSNSQVKTAQGGDLRLMTPGGGVNVGDLAGGGTQKSASQVGIVTVAGGEIDAVVKDSVDVNQSRIFTLDKGDVMLWARLGNLDAGRGAKTVVGAPPPLVTLDKNGQVVIDTSGSFSGSGIAVLNAASTLDLYAPMGEINAGEAGIKSAGNAFLGATVLVGADNLAVAGTGTGVPAKPPEAPTASLAGIASAASAGTTQTASVKDDDDDERRRRRTRRNLFLDFLGFGRGE